MVELLNLASERFGANILSFSDDFFGSCERMLGDSEPVFIEDKYDDHGKWMDGWESRRRRSGGHDWAVIRLAFSGVVSGVDIDTRYFTGNYPPEASIEGCYCEGGDGGEGDLADAEWFSLVERCSLSGDSHNLLLVGCRRIVSHVRLHIYPDGGVARLRIYGDVAYRFPVGSLVGDLVEVSGLGYGGRVIAYNNAHYGRVQSLLAPDVAKDMGDGWETRRRRSAGHDWLICSTSIASVIERIEIDTAFYKGNYPPYCSIQASLVDDSASEESIIASSSDWAELLIKQDLRADSLHEFVKSQLSLSVACNYFRLNIYPDGGISRLRLFGRYNERA